MAQITDKKLSLTDKMADKMTEIKYNATTGEQESKTVQKGAVIEHYDENNKLTKKETDKGQDLTETVEYEYDNDGKCIKETTTDIRGSISPTLSFCDSYNKLFSLVKSSLIGLNISGSNFT